MTLFFSMCFLILLTCMAFIINVGLFVKAKINLQNAVDAGAYAGAAVQARQLSNIAYMNWELRNVYKEWMFKYYILGQMANPRTDKNDSRGRYSPGAFMDFRVPRFQNSDQHGDYFNVPSTCIHFSGSEVNVCAIYSLPGLPRFAPLGLVGIDDTHNEFMNAIVKEKSNDCTKRANLNFQSGLLWIYGTGGAPLEGTPEIAADKIGAWPKAFELAVRIRNLEFFVNEPPSTAALCAVGGGAGGACEAITDYHQPDGTKNMGSKFALHERKVKAFWSAYRNLENNDGELKGAPNLKSTFRFTELAPNKVTSAEGRMDGILIPAGPGHNKFYLDLRLILLNFVNFYTLFSAFTGDFNDPNSPQKEAACNSIKAGLPVPAYPFGYIKNPEVLTYYAVKGEAEYTGLFNPFQSAAKLQAYAAAKPFGGRIGPMLFITKDGGVMARDRNFRSFPYISGLNAGGTAAFAQGYPMPIAQDFWVMNSGASSSVIGGHPGSAPVKYAIPNMIYDIITPQNLSDQDSGSQAIQDIAQLDDRQPSQVKGGLYSKIQFESFKSNLQHNPGTSLTGNMIGDAINRVRAPTRYEALNYLIPTHDPNGDLSSSQAVVPPDFTGNSPLAIPYSLLAPLFGPGTLFGEKNNIITIFDNFLTLNEPSIKKYLKALHDISVSMYTDSQRIGAAGNTTGASADNYIEAARSVHDSPDNAGGANTVTCRSIAGKFAGFFLGAPFSFAECPDKTGQPTNLRKNILKLWDQEIGRLPAFSTHFLGGYVNPFKRESSGSWGNLQFDPMKGKAMMTAYSPGTEYGATQEAFFPHPFTGLANVTPGFKMERNFYSSKLIALRTLAATYVQGNYTTYSEGTDKPPADILIQNFSNKLDSVAIPGGIENIKE